MDHPFSTILLPMQIIFAGVRRKDLFQERMAVMQQQAVWPLNVLQYGSCCSNRVVSVDTELETDSCEVCQIRPDPWEC